MAIKGITWDDLKRMGVDPDTGRLYWDGKEVVTALTLPWWVMVAAVVTAASSATLAITAVISLFQG